MLWQQQQRERWQLVWEWLAVFVGVAFVTSVVADVPSACSPASPAASAPSPAAAAAIDGTGSDAIPAAAADRPDAADAIPATTTAANGDDGQGRVLWGWEIALSPAGLGSGPSTSSVTSLTFLFPFF